MKIVSKDQKPLPNPFYGEYTERGLDPWHKDAAPDSLKGCTLFKSGKRKEGWFLLDSWGNQISFVADGTEILEEA